MKRLTITEAVGTTKTQALVYDRGHKLARALVEWGYGHTDQFERLKEWNYDFPIRIVEALDTWHTDIEALWCDKCGQTLDGDGTCLVCNPHPRTGAKA